MLDYILYITYLSFKFFVNIIPTKVVKYILTGISYIVYIIDKKHTKIALTNLDFAYKNKKTIDEKKDIAKKSYNNLLYNLYEFINNQDSTLADMEKKITIIDEQNILDPIKNNKRIILVTAHYGDWELAIPYVSLKYRPISIINKPIKNKYLNKMLLKARTNHNLEMFEKHGAAKKIIKALKNNRIVAMAIDQSISPSEASVVKFFGHNVTQTDAPIRLASKLDAVVIPFILQRDGFEQHKAIFHKPIETKKNLTEDEITAHSQYISDIFQTQILKAPNEWFWQHRRFKEFYKDLYN